MRCFVGNLMLCLLCAGLAHADFTTGMDAYMARDYQAAFEAFMPAALEGDDMSQYGLGLLYYKGQGVEQDLPRALAWYRLAAAQGHDHARKQADALTAKLTPEELAEADRLEGEVMGGGASTPPVAMQDPDSGQAAITDQDQAGSVLFGQKKQPEPVVEAGSQQPEAKAVTPAAGATASGVEKIFGPHLAKMQGSTPDQGKDLEPDNPEPAAQSVQPPAGTDPAGTLFKGMKSGAAGTASAIEGLSMVDEPEYVFFYPTGFVEGEQAGLAKIYADPEEPDFASLNLVIVELPADPGEPMTFDTCQEFAQGGFEDIKQQLGAQGMEVYMGKEPGLGVVEGQDFQRCSYMVMYVEDGRQKYAEQDMMYKVGTAKLYFVTATYADDSGYYGKVLRAKHEFVIK